jgi:aarF domain-containing kinase
MEDYQKYGMIGAITHLIKKDYYKVAEDFDFLGFLPADRPSLETYVPTFKVVFDQALQGGGAKSINFTSLSNELARVTYELPFRLPPFFALVIRGISILEGIALIGNPKFAIIDECYPYIAKRLLTDDSSYMKEALNNLIFDK